MILPIGAKNFEEAMQMGSETYHHLKVAFMSNILCWMHLYVSHISVVVHLYSYTWVQYVHQTVGNNHVSRCTLVSRLIAFTLAKFHHGVIESNIQISRVIFCMC
jgi:hypothetical protein